MNLNPMFLLIIAFVCVTIGYVAGVLISSLRGVKPESTGPQENPNSAEPVADNLIEVARLVREEARGPLQVKINDKHYRLSSELNHRDRDFMEETTVELLKWLGYSPNAQHPQEKSQEVPAAPAAEPVAESLAVPAASGGTGPLPPLRITPTAPAPAAAAVGPKSIVGQINDVLQDKLEGTPYAQRRIRLVESLNGVMVQIGLETYPDINSVPDEDIRNLIRASAAEWERRSSR
jgi:hypothetical protein